MPQAGENRIRNGAPEKKRTRPDRSRNIFRQSVSDRRTSSTVPPESAGASSLEHRSETASPRLSPAHFRRSDQTATRTGPESRRLGWTSSRRTWPGSRTGASTRVPAAIADMLRRSAAAGPRGRRLDQEGEPFVQLRVDFPGLRGEREPLPHPGFGPPREPAVRGRHGDPERRRHRPPRRLSAEHQRHRGEHPARLGAGPAAALRTFRGFRQHRFHQFPQLVGNHSPHQRIGHEKDHRTAPADRAIAFIAQLFPAIRRR